MASKPINYLFDYKRFLAILKNYISYRIIDNIPRIIKSNPDIIIKFVGSGYCHSRANKTRINLILLSF